MRHLSYIVDNRTVEPGIGATFLCIMRLHPPSTFWDVGANIGFYSWMVLSAISDSRAVLFEPDPENVALIEGTIANARQDRATLVRAAVSDSVGEAGFLVDEISTATGALEGSQDTTFLQRHYKHPQERLIVPTITLDAAAARHGVPDLAKIDVEGAEDRVLAGARNLLKDSQPILVVEATKGYGGEPIVSLREMGYRLMNADNINAPLETAGNYLCLPRTAASLEARVRALWPGELKRWAAARRGRAFTMTTEEV